MEKLEQIPIKNIPLDTLLDDLSDMLRFRAELIRRYKDWPADRLQDAFSKFIHDKYGQTKQIFFHHLFDILEEAIDKHPEIAAVRATSGSVMLIGSLDPCSEVVATRHKAKL